MEDEGVSHIGLAWAERDRKYQLDGEEGGASAMAAVEALPAWFTRDGEKKGGGRVREEEVWALVDGYIEGKEQPRHGTGVRSGDRWCTPEPGEENCVAARGGATGAS